MPTVARNTWASNVRPLLRFLTVFGLEPINYLAALLVTAARSGYSQLSRRGLTEVPDLDLSHILRFSCIGQKRNCHRQQAPTRISGFPRANSRKTFIGD